MDYEIVKKFLNKAEQQTAKKIMDNLEGEVENQLSSDKFRELISSMIRDIVSQEVERVLTKIFSDDSKRENEPEQKEQNEISDVAHNNEVVANKYTSVFLKYLTDNGFPTCIIGNDLYAFIAHNGVKSQSKKEISMCFKTEYEEKYVACFMSTKSKLVRVYLNKVIYTDIVNRIKVLSDAAIIAYFKKPNNLMGIAPNRLKQELFGVPKTWPNIKEITTLVNDRLDKVSSLEIYACNGYDIVVSPHKCARVYKVA